MPQWDASEPATGNWGGSATAVTTQSEHVAEATEFMTWMNTSQEAVNTLVAEGGLYPADQLAQEEALSAPPEFFSNQADFYPLAAETAATANSFTFGPNVNVAYSAYNDEFGKAAESRSRAAFVAAVEAMQEVTIEDLKDSGFSVQE
jgi:multiple sugar transport system substrate-binding protein